MSALDSEQDKQECPGPANESLAAARNLEGSAAQAALWRNVALFLLSGSLASVAWATASEQTVVAVLLQQMGFAKVVVGLPLAIGIVGFGLPQLPAAYWALRASRKRGWLVGLQVATSAPALVAALGAMLVAPDRPWASALLLFAPLMLGSLASGGARPLRTELDGRLIPQTTRGRYYGGQMVVRGVFGILGAGLAGLLLAEIAGRGGFATCFLAAALLGMAAAIPLKYLLEPRLEPEAQTEGLSTYTRNLWGRVTGDLNFRNFLWGRALVGLGYMSAGFYAVFALEKFHLPARSAPLFMIPSLLGQGIGSVIWGLAGDKKGHRLVQVALCVQWMLATVTAVLAPNAWVFAVAFFLSGMALAADYVSTNNFMIEAAPRAEMMGYTSLANSLIAPIFGLSTVLGGAIADLTSYHFLFWLSLGVYIVALWMMATRVKEPRLNGPASGRESGQ